MRSIRVPAFAKINLRLDVLGQRPDGYHELRTIFQSLTLHDTIVMTRTRNPGIELRVSGDSSLAASDTRKNLVWRAVTMLSSALGGFHEVGGSTPDTRLDTIRPASSDAADAVRGEATRSVRKVRVPRRLAGGVCIELVKRIPVGSGLGGGSSDAASAMAGLLRLTEKRIPLAQLLEIAGALGADVPYFLFGGRALGTGRGDEIYPQTDMPRQTVLVVSAHDISVSTMEAYARLDGLNGEAGTRLTKDLQASKLRSFCALCWSPRGIALSNDFERAVFQWHSRLDRIRRDLLEQGAAGASLAGSGSAVFAIFRNPAQARRAARKFPEDRVFLCSTQSRKAYARALWGSVEGIHRWSSADESGVTPVRP